MRNHWRLLGRVDSNHRLPDPESSAAETSKRPTFYEITEETVTRVRKSQGSHAPYKSQGRGNDPLLFRTSLGVNSRTPRRSPVRLDSNPPSAAFASAMAASAFC